MSPETFATAAGKQTGTCGSSGAAVSVLGLEHNEADHDGDETYGGDHQGEDDGRRRVAQLLDGAVHEELLVEFHKPSLHQRVGPRDQQAVGYLLRAVAQVTVKAAGGGGHNRAVRYLHALVAQKKTILLHARTSSRNNSPVHVTPFAVVGAVELLHRVYKFVETLQVEQNVETFHRVFTVKLVTYSAISQAVVAFPTLCIT